MNTGERMLSERHAAFFDCVATEMLVCLSSIENSTKTLTVGTAETQRMIQMIRKDVDLGIALVIQLMALVDREHHVVDLLQRLNRECHNGTTF